MSGSIPLLPLQIMAWIGKIIPFHPFNKGLGWLHSRSGHFGEDINPLPVLGFEPRIVQTIA
jgi:hypothetical protein